MCVCVCVSVCACVRGCVRADRDRDNDSEDFFFLSARFSPFNCCLSAVL